MSRGGFERHHERAITSISGRLQLKEIWSGDLAEIGEALAESDVRAKYIDPLFRTGLGWPEAKIRLILRTDACGFIDHVAGWLRRTFLIEAKRHSRQHTPLADKAVVQAPRDHTNTREMSERFTRVDMFLGYPKAAEEREFLIFPLFAHRTGWGTPFMPQIGPQIEKEKRVIEQRDRKSNHRDE